MIKLNNSTYDCMSELSYNLCDETEEYKVHEDCETPVFESFVNTAYQRGVPLIVVKRNPICPVCNKPLTRNGTKTMYLNKKVEVKCQKYIHKKCENSSCIASLRNIKDKFCTYMRSIRDKGIIKSLMGYISYQNKKESISDQYEIDVPRSTILYHEQEVSDNLIKELETEQCKRIKNMNIRPSGIYCYDEQYVFIKKQLYMHMTLLDHKAKLVIYEHLVSKEDFNDTTVENFLKTAINTQPLNAIITDGRKSYKSIIEATGAIHQRCYFHLMHNLMTPLTKHNNKIKRRNKTLTKKIEEKEEKINILQKNKKKYPGRVPHKDKKTRKQLQKIKKLQQEIKIHKKEIKTNTQELDKTMYDKKRIQKIFTAKTHKQATRRFNTIYNQRTQVNTHIQHFLEKIKPELEIILNHTTDEEIPATNNTVENYYRTTLPRSQKRIYKTIRGLKIRIKLAQIRWTHRNVLNEDDNINHNTYK